MSEQFIIPTFGVVFCFVVWIMSAAVFDSGYQAGLKRGRAEALEETEKPSEEAAK